MDSKPDFVIYRVLGNALPPRHDAGDTVRNLRYVLDNEPDLPGCEKRWLLNRIVDGSEEARCLELIRAAGQACHVIAFDPGTYRSALFDASGMPEHLNPISAVVAGGKTPSATEAARGNEWLLRHKSLALIDLNGARNIAIELGRRDALWTLPLDGFCYLTLEAWLAFAAGAAAHPEALYAMLPTVRLDENAQLDAPASLPEPLDEPMIAFHRNAPDRFDERLRYGNRNKVELLMRLRYPGPWDGWKSASWDTQPHQEALAPDRFVRCGRVYRLASGAPRDIDTNSGARFAARFRGVGLLVDDLDRDLLEDAWLQGGHDHGVLLAGAGSTDPALVGKLCERADTLARQESSEPRSLREEVAALSVLTAAGVLCGRPADLGRAAGRICDVFGGQEKARSFLRPPVRLAALRELWVLPALCRTLAWHGALTPEASRSVVAWVSAILDLAGRPHDENRPGVWVCLLRISLSLFCGRFEAASHLLQTAPLRLVAQGGARGLRPDGTAADLPTGLKNLTAWVLLADLSRAAQVDLWRYRGVDGQSICNMARTLAGAMASSGKADQTLREWLAALTLLMPQDAADRDGLPSGDQIIVSARDDGPDRGLPPFWSCYLLPPKAHRFHPGATSRHRTPCPISLECDEDFVATQERDRPGRVVSRHLKSGRSLEVMPIDPGP